MSVLSHRSTTFYWRWGATQRSHPASVILSDRSALLISLPMATSTTLCTCCCRRATRTATVVLTNTLGVPARIMWTGSIEAKPRPTYTVTCVLVGSLFGNNAGGGHAGSLKPCLPRSDDWYGLQRAGDVGTGRQRLAIKVGLMLCPTEPTKLFAGF